MFSYSSKDGINGNDYSVPTCNPSSVTNNTPPALVKTSKPPATASDIMETTNVSGEAIASLKDTIQRGCAYANEGNLAMAEKIYEQALSGCEMKHGSQHQATLAIMTTLGHLYADKGEAGKAERLYRKVLDVEEQTLGRDDKSTLGTVLNLGALLSEK
ncbi:hypothetical protein BJ875DRAFT_5473 [Amylocarpus encephaloides]|uniref:MalT-like TPR region domain-containing protein n=1 Tax=Amylocarpus encephaloides TaxID=45428 RepID=A0A9P7YKH7_9HELO|nr:hypothetical protein BJ875DRAFT_5473 [Amylocarpus encephaloides]